ncbi:MAG: hypothetical protein KBG20_11780 [Caldilineaceae bacterium]|nr:hypothetical protein [Caldilineaceae bacterium]MBP8108334.1 hypothetical protein [Caldilineaceae bacterium]MBP8122524.1 hypothetical protein [Caldilineaceae bacterium]MBP9072977.1 hypothetical protein [Caldilineaceae bacterium]
MKLRRFFTLTLTTLVVLGLLVPSVGVGSVQAAPAADSVATTDDEIVYLDGSGCVMVKDTNQLSASHQLVTFDSRLFGDCGWTDIATGDFNNDGDAEIVAVGQSAGSGKLTIFDPVYRNSDAEGAIGQIPWKRIYTLTKPGSPITVVGAGNMNTNVAGDEIFIGYTVSEANNINHRIEVLIATNPSGTSWTSHINKSFGGPWESVQVGNINNAGSDDVVLIRNIPLSTGEVSSLIEAHQIDNDFATIWSNGGTDREWNSAAIGQVYAGGTGEVVALRQFAGYAPSATFFIFGYTGGTLKEADGDALAFFPYPDYTFVADINGNGDDEAFFLRDLPAEAPSTMARMVMRNRGSDTLPTFELPLSDNGYVVGAGGDVDADGKDEVVLLRSNGLRIYQSPDTNQIYDDLAVSTNNKSLRLANVDGTGYSAGARLTVEPASIIHSLQSSLADSQWTVLNVTNSGTSGVINFTVEAPVADWILEFAVDSNATPAKIFIKFDATKLSPGLYLGPRITLRTSTANVINPTVVIPIALTVTPASFQVSPSAVNTIYGPSQPLTAPMTTTLAINGTPGVTYSAGILSMPALAAAQAAFESPIAGGYVDETGQLVLRDTLGYIYKTGVAAVGGDLVAADISWPSGVPWAAASSLDGIVSDTVKVVVTGSSFSSGYQQAMLLLVADAKAGSFPENVRYVSISGMNAASMIMLPIMGR